MQTDVIRSLANAEGEADSETVDVKTKSQQTAVSDSKKYILVGLATVGFVYFVTSINDRLHEGSLRFTCGYTQAGLLDPTAHKFDLLIDGEWSAATLKGFMTGQDETFSITGSDKGYIFSGDMLYSQKGEPDELRYEKRYIFKKMITPDRWNSYHYANYDSDPVLAYACRED